MTLNLQIEIEETATKEWCQMDFKLQFFQEKKIIKVLRWSKPSNGKWQDRRTLSRWVPLYHLHNNLYLSKLAWCTLQSRHFMRIRSFSLPSPLSALLYNQKTKLWLVSQSWSWELRGLRWVRNKTRTQDHQPVVQSRALIGRKVSEGPSTPPVLTLVLGEI